CATLVVPIPAPLKQRILQLCQPGSNEIERLGALDVELGNHFAEVAMRVVEKAGLTPAEIQAIGSHGQTVRHEPTASTPFTLQIGDPNVIAQRSGITTVADFRRRDLAVGGQGAPLAPAYHHWFLRQQRGVVVNIGGMANVTLLSTTSEAVIGFDTGPGNVLIDSWLNEQKGEAMDRDGQWAAQGVVCQRLLEQMSADPFFAQPPPKSTGREHFNHHWLHQQLEQLEPTLRLAISVYDCAATLTELTAMTIADAILRQSVETGDCWVCGGGAHNPQLLLRLQAHLPGWRVESSVTVGMEPDWVEAMAFAWLARQTLRGESGNLPSVTGADQSVILGAIFPVESYWKQPL
ncbi:MAG: anhydro-N-acetylmuramic acid kinase, partial [Gammaproteobacteria bacterium]|nr:anhydro-N-acetylmuramic acid kinase [Gammaproteobacteria bacterium]